MEISDLARRVVERLEALNLTAYEVERKMGKSKGFLYDLLAGKKETIRGAESQAALASILQTNRSWLFFGAGDAQDKDGAVSAQETPGLEHYVLSEPFEIEGAISVSGLRRRRIKILAVDRATRRFVGIDGERAAPVHGVIGDPVFAMGGNGYLSAIASGSELDALGKEIEMAPGRTVFFVVATAADLEKCETA